ncbi:hypothetical protein [Mycolicibacterium sp. lyk4-40-TYG-92]|uniref:hypothetical protein n=1 Tax=Mycolicibacterium sp. lyk4-40-TYG-92 TaxID=3040295 RepID=UPI00254C7377|nr:hypothetical protein [Mycolicibacterium sp. lyk4-40-TYG-92]
MLTSFDDYPIHQSALPLTQTGNGNPHHYDRFWFNGFREDLFLGVAFGSYPNRQIMDGAFSVVHEGVQRSVFASGRSNPDPVDTHIGPIRIEIVEPMRINRLIVEAPEHGLQADLIFTATTAAVEEARQIKFVGALNFMDATRATQWGTWTGTLVVDGKAVDLKGGIPATKDRSWGTRRIGRLSDGAPEAPPEVLFLWSPIHFDDECFHQLTFENPDGSQWAHEGLVIPKIAPGTQVVAAAAEPTRFARVEHHIEWRPGARRAKRATLLTHGLDGTVDEMHLEPLMTFQMKGIGYGHPTWSHGRWHDELAVGGEYYDVESEDPLRPENLHVQQLVQATWRGKTGLGVLEQIMLGRHHRYGFNTYLGPK